MYGVLSKIISESLLSAYPVFVKYIKIPIFLQMWSRFFSYVVVAAFFMDWSYVAANLLSYDGIMLALLTIGHIYVSYKGFLKLDSGAAYSIFYTYPVMILLLSGFKIPPGALLAIAGVWLLASTSALDRVPYEGVIMILLAAFSEALIFFVVKRLKTKNNWDHLFISYFLGALLFTFYFLRAGDTSLTTTLTESLGINTVIALGGYILRFYAITHLDVFKYALLSNLGMVTAYLYGYLMGENFTFTQAVGTACIIYACAKAH
jgi:drug/metabolite transporter (DMT)-like permease